MARNEEKQLGKLNRLWLQKERDEGHIKDVHEHRPKLSTLNSASSIKKWIPSIKSEIEYYLQQSQLSHYPERKIAAFQLSIQGLEKEYKRFICKLQALDPTCKHQPWTPRAYTKRRADTHISPNTAKKSRGLQSCDLSRPVDGAQSNWVVERTGSDATSASENQVHFHQSGTFLSPFPVDLTNPSPAASESTNPDQDQPLTFDRTRLAVVLAGSRGPLQPGSSHTQSLARVLLSGLPNLHSSPLGRAIAAQDRDNTRGERLDSTGTGGAHSTINDEKSIGHVLGLGCYSSSDDEADT
uniref:Si:dkey-86e18.1 n=1 Tax=Hucho hucho TaxID=62062 RepID=A0A4W5NSS0_9TELE